MHAVAARHVLHDEPEGADVVGGGQHVVVAEVDFMLTPRRLVMRRLDLEAHLLEHQDDLPPDVLALVDRREIEVPRRVVRLGGRLVVAGLEEEEFRLRPGAHGVPTLLGFGDGPLERLPRTSRKRRPVRIGDVTDESGDLLPRWVDPRKDAECRQVGRQEHVRLLDPHEPFDRRAVEHHAAIERRRKLAVRHLDVLDHTQDVGELQAQELHASRLGLREDLFLARLQAGVAYLVAQSGLSLPVTV